MDDVEKPEPDAAEQAQGLDPAGEEDAAEPLDGDVPEADALEQRRPARDGGDGPPHGVPAEAPEADVIEQSQAAGDDEDEDWR